ncbi:ribose 5-phosphate isomerase B [bacterium]|nr:ribose 5-phosphate isomerase B [bacterium]
MKIALSSDHAGYEMKQHLVHYALDQGHEVIDLGTDSDQSVDYPDFAHALSKTVLNREADLGVAVCGSGNGINIALNRHRGIRAILAWNRMMAEMGRRHNDANVLSLPGRYMDLDEATQVFDVFVQTEFEGGRHQGRVEKIEL